LVCFDVIRRWLFNDTEAWIMELEWHLFALVFLFGAGYTLKHDKHVRVDLFYASFSERDKAWVNLLGTLFFLLPWCVLIVIVSWGYGMESWSVKEGSPDPGGLPARYMIKFAIPIGISLLLLQGLAECAKAVLVLTKKSNSIKNNHL
jgi:TRAP-type mannitol/chloroaromatic compound transport system permease small subunit